MNINSSLNLTSSLEVVVTVSHELNARPLRALGSRDGAFSSRPLSLMWLATTVWHCTYGHCHLTM